MEKVYSITDLIPNYQYNDGNGGHQCLPVQFKKTLVADNGKEYFSKEKITTVANIQNVRHFKHTEQYFLNDIHQGYNNRKTTNLTNFQKDEKIDFILLSIISTNSACENCFTSLKSLITNYQHEGKRTLKEEFLSYFFGNLVPIDVKTPLHIVYSSVKFPTHREKEMRDVRDNKSYQSLNLAASEKNLFIYNIYEPSTVSYGVN
jgi:hypothetical protein